MAAAWLCPVLCPSNGERLMQWSRGPPRWLRRLEHMAFKGNVKELDLFILEKAGGRRVDLVISSSTLWTRSCREDAYPSQEYTVKEEKTSSSEGNYEDIRIKYFQLLILVEHCSRLHRGILHLHPWRDSKLAHTKPQTTWLELKVSSAVSAGLDDA